MLHLYYIDNMDGSIEKRLIAALKKKLNNDISHDFGHAYKS